MLFSLLLQSFHYMIKTDENFFDTIYLIVYILLKVCSATILPLIYFMMMLTKQFMEIIMKHAYLNMEEIEKACSQGQITRREGEELKTQLERCSKHHKRFGSVTLHTLI